ncbi:hypothetical protein [Kribbella catacumbae]|uniref:hypothetical protein n=1 Tax=Kribbella catacumbae TaxID=460086 RepID=UPI0012FA413C|nr:hypothetical protein [Kribbella catacumbae]
MNALRGLGMIASAMSWIRTGGRRRAIAAGVVLPATTQPGELALTHSGASSLSDRAAPTSYSLIGW